MASITYILIIRSSLEFLWKWLRGCTHKFLNFPANFLQLIFWMGGLIVKVDVFLSLVKAPLALEWLYCEQSPSETTVYFQSHWFNDATQKIIRVFMWKCNRWNGVGRKRRKRKREKESGRLTEWEKEHLVRNGNGMGWKWTLVKKDTLVFLVKQINRLFIILGGSQILLFPWHCNIQSHDNVFLHNRKIIVRSSGRSTHEAIFTTFYSKLTNVANKQECYITQGWKACQEQNSSLSGPFVSYKRKLNVVNEYCPLVP